MKKMIWDQLVKGGKLVYKLMNDKSLSKHIKSHGLPMIDLLMIHLLIILKKH
jgi:hypothetical protein